MVDCSEVKKILIYTLQIALFPLVQWKIAYGIGPYWFKLV